MQMFLTIQLVWLFQSWVFWPWEIWGEPHMEFLYGALIRTGK